MSAMRLPAMFNVCSTGRLVKPIICVIEQLARYSSLKDLGKMPLSDEVFITAAPDSNLSSWLDSREQIRSLSNFARFIHANNSGLSERMRVCKLGKLKKMGLAPFLCCPSSFENWSANPNDLQEPWHCCAPSKAADESWLLLRLRCFKLGQFFNPVFGKSERGGAVNGQFLH